MKTSELDELLATLRRHRVLAFEMGPVKVSFHPSALVPDAPAQPVQTSAPKQPQPSEPDDGAEEDPDLFYSTEP